MKQHKPLIYCLSGIFLLASVIWKFYILDIKRDFSFVHLEPFIVGKEMCSSNLTYSQWEKGLFLIAAKGTLKGTWGSDRVVVKSLGNIQEWREVDAASNVFRTVQENFSPQFNRDLINDKILDVMYTHFPGGLTAKLHLCPQVKDPRPLTELLTRWSDNLFAVWTILKINPEPIMLEILQPPHWPVPKYFGGCGRLAVVEDCGETLTFLRDAPVNQRLQWAYEILDAAFQFTFSHTKFSFYFLDISPDNIAVGPKGARFIDLENVIMVNRTALDELPDISLEHKSTHTDCQGCIYFSPQDICGSKVSDHNIYGTCKEILSSDSVMDGGLLHSLPSNLSSYNISTLLGDCISPPESKTRFEIARLLKDAIKRALFEEFNHTSDD